VTVGDACRSESSNWEICDAELYAVLLYRRRLGIVVTMFVPGHSGVSANEYADFVAKAHIDDEPDELIDMVARHVRTRP